MWSHRLSIRVVFDQGGISDLIRMDSHHDGLSDSHQGGILSG